MNSTPWTVASVSLPVERQIETVSQRYGDDHDRLDALFQRFRALRATAPGEAARTLGEFKAGLLRHMRWEDEILFPEFDARARCHSGSPTVFLTWEHEHLRRYLDRVEQHLSSQTVESEVERIVFFSLLGAHNRKEEHLVYSRLDEWLEPEDRLRVFAAMRAP